MKIDKKTRLINAKQILENVILDLTPNDEGMLNWEENAQGFKDICRELTEVKKLVNNLLEGE